MFGRGRKELLHLKGVIEGYGSVPDRATAFHAERRAVLSQIEENLGAGSWIFIAPIELAEINERASNLTSVAAPLGKLCNDAEALQARISRLEQEAERHELGGLSRSLGDARARCRQVGGRCVTARQVKASRDAMEPLSLYTALVQRALKVAERGSTLLRDHRRWETSIVREGFREEVDAFVSTIGDAGLTDQEVDRFMSRLEDLEASQVPTQGLSNGEVHRLLQEALAWSKWLRDDGAAGEYREQSQKILKAGSDDAFVWMVSADLEDDVVGLRERAKSMAEQRLEGLRTAGKLAQQAEPSIDASLASELEQLGDPTAHTPKLLAEWTDSLEVLENRFRTRVVNFRKEVREFLEVQETDLRDRLHRVLESPHDESTGVTLADIQARLPSILEGDDGDHLIDGLRRAAKFSCALEELEEEVAAVLEPLRCRQRELQSQLDQLKDAFVILGERSPTLPTQIVLTQDHRIDEMSEQLDTWQAEIASYRSQGGRASEREHEGIRRDLKSWRSALRRLSIKPPHLELPVPSDDPLESATRLVAAYEVRRRIGSCLEENAELVMLRLDEVSNEVDELLIEPQLPEDGAQLTMARDLLTRWRAGDGAEDAARLALMLDDIEQANDALNRLLATERGIERERGELEFRLSYLRKADETHQFEFHIARASALLHGLEVMPSAWDLASREAQKDRCAEIVEALEEAIELDVRMP